MFRIQLIVNRQLEGKENLWLRCLDNRLKEKELYQSLKQSYDQHKNEPRYSVPMNAIIWSNYVQEGEQKVMCEALYDLFAEELIERENKGKEEGKAEGRAEGKAEGRAEGKAEGRAEGKAEGEEYFASLTEKLLTDFRTEDLLRATKDKAFRAALYQEYGIKTV